MLKIVTAPFIGFRTSRFAATNVARHILLEAYIRVSQNFARRSGTGLTFDRADSKRASEGLAAAAPGKPFLVAHHLPLVAAAAVKKDEPQSKPELNPYS